MKKQKREKLFLSATFMVIGFIYITCLISSNVISSKMMAIGSITLPSAVLLFPITYIVGDIMTEVYGFEKARLIIWAGFACNLFAVLIFMLTVILPYPDFWTNQDAYVAVLSTTPRILLASLTGYLFGEFSNSIVLSKLKVVTKGKRLWLRTILSTVVGELLDSIIFITIAFIGTMDIVELLKMILFQYLFKVLYEVLCTPLTYFVVRKVKDHEQIDKYDYEVKYKLV